MRIGTIVELFFIIKYWNTIISLIVIALIIIFIIFILRFFVGSKNNKNKGNYSNKRKSNAITGAFANITLSRIIGSISCICVFLYTSDYYNAHGNPSSWTVIAVVIGIIVACFILFRKNNGSII